jgi:hypothetical protein
VFQKVAQKVTFLLTCSSNVPVVLFSDAGSVQRRFFFLRGSPVFEQCERKSEKAKGNGNEQANAENQQSSRNPRGQQKGKARENSSRRDYSDLPAKEEVYDVDEAEQSCPHCGPVNPRIASEETSEIIEIEVNGYRRKIIKKKRGKGCQCDTGLPVILTAQGPGRLLPRSPYGVSIWVELLLNKFRYALPVNRRINRLEAVELSLPVGTITDGLAGMLPLFEELYETIKVGNRWQLWVFHSHQAVVYRLKSSRSAEVPMDKTGSERALRLSKWSVKNSYGALSNWSIQLTEILLSIFASLQRWKIHPRLWLTRYLQACAANSGKVPQTSKDYLPWHLSPERLKEFQQGTPQADLDSS